MDTPSTAAKPQEAADLRIVDPAKARSFLRHSTAGLPLLAFSAGAADASAFLMLVAAKRGEVEHGFATTYVIEP